MSSPVAEGDTRRNDLLALILFNGSDAQLACSNGSRLESLPEELRRSRSRVYLEA